ncbi:MAG TPA: hypothetical protein VI216_08530 [Candidatus Acidoferrales bacterium]|nr:hypothetical protein [Terriglobia bacterium]
MTSCKRIPASISSAITIVAALIAAIGIGVRPTPAEQLKKETAAAFDQYIRLKETRDERRISGQQAFLWIDALPEPNATEAYAKVRRGQVLTRRNEDCGAPDCSAIPGGLIHDWVGVVFIPGVSLAQAISALQDYDRDADYYRPDVLKSKLLDRSGDVFHVFLRLKQVHVITVVLDTEYEVHYQYLDAAHAVSRSYSTRIAEVENAGEADEHDRPTGDDRGLLWRLYSYWRFYQADGGIYIQCNAVSLTRDVPAGLGWLIRPFIQKIPSESLRFTLDATRAAVVKKFERASKGAREGQ